MSLLPIFIQYPEEGAIIGRLLAGYSELEVGLMLCVIAIRNDLNMALKTMYRIRGEAERIRVADGLSRQYFHAIKLGTPFEMTIGAMDHCRKIRNQYSHCVWYGDGSGFVKFSPLDEMAREHEVFTSFEGLPLRRVDLKLLQSQEAYFDHVSNLLIWLRHQATVLLGRAKANPYPKPKVLGRPDLYTP